MAGTRGRGCETWSRRDGDVDEVEEGDGGHEDLAVVGDAVDDEVGHERREILGGDLVDAGSSLKVRHVGGSTWTGSGKRTRKRNTYK